MTNDERRLVRLTTLLIGTIAKATGERLYDGPGDQITRATRQQVCNEIHEACLDVDSIVDRLS